MIGGGSTPRPGEISLAHHGVLFLDEFPEYRRAAIEALRAPLENGKVLITRARGSMEFPARVQLIGAMNPCPCGRLGSDGQRCDCSAIGIQKYMQKLSQPILDRIDLHVELEPVPLSVLTSNFAHARAEADDLRAMVRRARVTQIERSGKLNSTLGTEELKQQIDLDTRSKTLLERSSQQLGFTARSFVRILRTAQTIADIQGDKHVTSTHIAEAISLRKLERLQKHVQAA